VGRWQRATRVVSARVPAAQCVDHNGFQLTAGERPDIRRPSVFGFARVAVLTLGIAVATAAALSGSSWLAVETGEADEERGPSSPRRVIARADIEAQIDRVQPRARIAEQRDPQPVRELPGRDLRRIGDRRLLHDERRKPLVEVTAAKAQRQSWDQTQRAT